MKLSLFLMVIVIMTSCEPFRYYPRSEYTTSSPDQTRLTKLPIYLHENEVEVFFPDEKPTEPYVKAFLLEQIAYGEVSYAELVKKLKKQAYDKGADAILLLSRNRSISESESSYTVTNMASALGIKYLKNMSFREKTTKEMVLSAFSNEKAIYIKKEIIPSTPDNYAIEPWNYSLYLDNFYHYSLDYMLYEKNKNWSYLFDFEEQKVKTRKYIDLKNVFKFSYDHKGRVSSVLKQSEMHDFEIEIKFLYKNGYLYKKEIYQKSNPYAAATHKRTEIFEYNHKGILLRRLLFLIDTKGEPQPYMSLAYEFYTKEEYNGLLKKEKKTN